MLQQQGSSMSETKSSQRFHSLNADQVEVLHQVLSEVVPIHGRGNFPTLELRPRDIIIAVRARLESQGITVRDVRLNGSTASHVLVRDNGTNYKDLDIIFGVELPSQEEFEVIKESVLGCLLNCLPAGVNRERISSATMKEAYVQKMVKVFNEHDRWSLISLSNNSGKNLELKFVSALRRQFEFSVDSFQIILDRLLESYMQQETQHKQTTADLKDQLSDQYAENQTDSSSPLKQANSTETNNSTDEDSPAMEETPTSQTLLRDMVQEKESQTEHLRQTHHPKLMTKLNSENKKTKQLPELKETTQAEENLSESNVCDQTSLNLLTEEKQTSENTQPPTQTELRQEPELLKTTQYATKVDNLQQTQPCDCQHPSHFKETSASNLQDEHKEPAEHTEQAKTHKKSNIAQTEHVNVAELGSSEVTNSFIEDMSRNEEDEALHVSTLDSSTSLHLKIETQLTDERNVETEMLGQKEGERDTERNGMTKEISASEGESVRETQGIDCSCSNSSTYFTPHNTQPSGIEATENIYNPLPTGNSDKKPKTLDALSPPDTQDILPTPLSLVSDKKTSSSPCKASDRLSNMVVLKHSSPKPPRRMCRKIIPSQFPSPSSDSDPGPEPCLNPEPEIGLKHKLPSCGSDPNTIPTTSVSEKIKLGPDPTLSRNFLDNIDPNSIPVPSLNLISHPPMDLRPTLPHELPVSQVITESSDKTNIQGLRDTDSACAVSHDQCQSSIGETVSLPKQSEPPDSVDALVSHTDTLDINTQEPLHTSEVELSEKDKNGELQTKSLVLIQEEGDPQVTTTASSSTSYCVTHPITCLTSPVLSLSPPCFSSPSLSPPQCHTPPSHCLPSQIMNTVSSATSFSTPSLSVSPTSSCHSSPPYLTPPMLSLSPPPLCLSPPSPCLSPPLLCLTPPVESEDFVSQVSSDKEPLILNTDSEELLIEASPQPGIPLLQLEDKKTPDYITSLPLVSELVSFPITISSSTKQEVPHSQSRGPEESASPPANNVPCSMTESTEVTEIPSETPELSNNPQASSLLPAVEVLAESMYGDFEAAMDHLRYRLIATRNPEEIRGGGLLKYSNLLVRDYRPASETQIKTLERYMCSRFFIDFPDVQEQQRKILSYLKNHFIGEERSKYQYLMTLRRVVDDSTVCLMGHERRQTLNMITVLALKVLGEQNIIPNTDHVTCFYQPAPYLAEHSAPYLVEPSYCSYYIPQGGSTLLYQPYPLHLQTQTGLV